MQNTLDVGRSLTAKETSQKGLGRRTKFERVEGLPIQRIPYNIGELEAISELHIEKPMIDECINY